MTDFATRLLNDVDTAQRVRLLDTHRATPDGPLAVRGGVRPDGGCVVSVVPSSMNVKLTRFSADVPGTVTAQGGYVFVHDDPTATYAVDPGATGDRIDLVVARVRDNAHDGSGSTDADVVIVKGDPNTGLVPSVPAGSIPLWELNVTSTASAGTGGLTVGADRRRFSVAAGGVVPVASDTERDAISSPAAGALVFNAASGAWEGYDGTDWVSLIDAAFKPATTTITSFESGYEANSFGYAPSVRVWANEKVELRGGIKKTSGNIASNQTLGTLPPAAWPEQTQEFAVAVTSQSPTSTVRLEIKTDGAINVYMGSLTSGWVALDGIAYYKS